MSPCSFANSIRSFANNLRSYTQCLTGEALGSLRCDCNAQLYSSQQMIGAAGRGAVVYQFQEGRGIGLLNKIKAYALQDAGYDTIEANELLGFPADMRVFSQCAEIVRNLGISRVRAMTANPKKIEALRNAGLEVVERVATEVEVDVCAQRYLETKRERMGHFADVVKCHKTPPVRIAPR